MTASKSTTPTETATPSKRRLRRIASRVALVVGGLCVGLVLAELSLWALGLPRVHYAHSQPPRFSFWTDPDTSALHHTNARSVTFQFIYEDNPRKYFGSKNEIDYVTNSSGMRGPEFIVTKPPELFRLVFLGDSCTFGEGVKFADTYPEQTAELLSKQLTSPLIAVESFNLGVSGYNTQDESFLLHHAGLVAEPDAVVLGYCLNDPEPPLFFGREGTETERRYREIETLESANTRFPPNALFRLRTARLVWQFFDVRRRNQRMIDYYHGLYDESKLDWRANRAALLDIVNTCAARDIPCIVVIIPVLHELNDRYPFADLHEKVREAIGDRAIVLDLLPVLKNRQAKDLWVHLTDHHPNEIVHGLLAQQLADEIVKHCLLAPKSADKDAETSPDIK